MSTTSNNKTSPLDGVKESHVVAYFAIGVMIGAIADRCMDGMPSRSYYHENPLIASHMTGEISGAAMYIEYYMLDNLRDSILRDVEWATSSLNSSTDDARIITELVSFLHDLPDFQNAANLHTGLWIKPEIRITEKTILEEKIKKVIIGVKVWETVHDLVELTLFPKGKPGLRDTILPLLHLQSVA